MLLSVWRLLRRRWLIAIAGLLLAVSICVWVNAQVGPAYRASGQMMFLLPPEQPDPEDPPVNPYLNLPDGMGATANLIAGMLTTDDVARSLEAQGLVAEYTVIPVPGSGPVLDFQVTAADPSTALDTRNALMDLVDKRLAELQEEAKTPANQIMTASRPTVSQTAVKLNAPVYKAVGAAGAAGVALMILLCLLVDRLVLFRAARARRALARGSSAPEPVTDASVPVGTRVQPKATTSGLQVVTVAHETDPGDNEDEDGTEGRTEGRDPDERDEREPDAESGPDPEDDLADGAADHVVNEPEALPEDVPDDQPEEAARGAAAARPRTEAGGMPSTRRRRERTARRNQHTRDAGGPRELAG